MIELHMASWLDIVNFAGKASLGASEDEVAFLVEENFDKRDKKKHR
jgi:hypothetical protein